MDTGAPATENLVTAYLATLQTKAPSTLDAYGRVLRQFTSWIAQRPGSDGRFQPDQLTVTALDTYLKDLAAHGTSISHQTRIKTVVSGFARWLIEDQGLLRRNPARSVTVPPQPLCAPRKLEPDQRYVLRSLVERDGAPRSAALFALGYWAGCRVSDIAWLRLEHTHLTRKAGWLHIGYKGSKIRDIDLKGEARGPLYDYLLHGGRDVASPYVFISQRYERLTEAGIHHWFRTLKARATQAEWDLIHDVTFHDLRHDFAHRACQGLEPGGGGLLFRPRHAQGHARHPHHRPLYPGQSGGHQDPSQGVVWLVPLRTRRSAHDGDAAQPLF